MGRVTAAMTRLLQSMCRPWETMLQCYLGELLVMVQGAKDRRDQVLSMIVLTMRALGVKVEARRASRGSSVTWVGITLRASKTEASIETGVSQQMVSNLLQTLVTWTTQDEIPLEQLRKARGDSPRAQEGQRGRLGARNGCHCSSWRCPSLDSQKPSKSSQARWCGRRFRCTGTTCGHDGDL